MGEETTERPFAEQSWISRASPSFLFAHPRAPHEAHRRSTEATLGCSLKGDVAGIMFRGIGAWSSSSASLSFQPPLLPFP